MNGAHALIGTLTANDVTACFANPGTSEMHFVAALDDSNLDVVLCLFEGVATGAADGFARASGRSAATLLHLGPGLANGWANLHNARRARTPVLNIVGDHATYHAAYDAPLQSDIERLASTLEGWSRRTLSPDALARDAADALSAAYGPPSVVATLVVPADVSWGDVTEIPPTWPVAARCDPLAIDDATLRDATLALRSRTAALVLGGSALTKDQLALAQRVATAAGARLLVETFPTVIERGASVVSPERIVYLSEFAQAQLGEYDAVILIGACEPVGFFAYPGVASRLIREGGRVINLAPPGADTRGALTALVEEFSAPLVAIERAERPSAPRGELTPHSFAAAIGATLREGVVVVDESNTSGVHLWDATRAAPDHRWMTLTGGAIGYALPVAIGAAFASRQRTLVLESDGSMMYTLQALWTMARENLDVTVVALANRSYAILNMELRRVGARHNGTASARLLSLDDPTLDLAGVARSLGVPSLRVSCAEDLVNALERSYATAGPTFIEAVFPDYQK